MAYVVMARKWRPKNFDEMVGQEHIAQTISNAITGNRIAHAFLFTGTRGVGKTTSARILAKALNCEKGPTPHPCDDCSSCRSVTLGSSMDVLEIDGASNNSVDDIRDLREQVKYAPMNGRYKIYIIDEVHMLSRAAFNALLKTLEEPPDHVIFIFATTEANKLPPTILSRVQRFDFKRISETHIRERLEFICSREGVRPEREALEAVARKADGSMRDALSLFDQVYAYSGADFTMEAARKVLGLPSEKIYDAMLDSLLRHDRKAGFEILRETHGEGVEISELLAGFGEFLRDLLFVRHGAGAATLGLGETRYAQLSAMAPELTDGDILRFAKMVSDTLTALKFSPNPGMTVELGFARMASLDRVVNLAQVLGREEPSATEPPRSVAAPVSEFRPISASGQSIEAGDQPEGKKKNPPDELAATERGISPAPQAESSEFPESASMPDAPLPEAPPDFSGSPGSIEAPAATGAIETAGLPETELRLLSEGEMEDALKKEPILGVIRDLFEGRLVT